MDVAAYISQQNPVHQAHLTTFRKLILEATPAIQEHIKYGVPFYTYHGLLCYLMVSHNQVRLGLCRGAEMNPSNDYLTGEGKLVRHVCVSPGDAVPLGPVRELIQEALLLNEWYARIKKTAKA